MARDKKEGRKDPAYQREQGTKSAVGAKQRTITFSLAKHIKGEGKSIEEWNALGLLGELNLRIKLVGQHAALHARQSQMIKEYTKLAFPPESEFTHPKHVGEVTWAVMHITPKSKEVVVGYIEDDVFYIIFLDKEHVFFGRARSGIHSLRYLLENLSIAHLLQSAYFDHKNQ